MLDCWLWDVVDCMRHEEDKIAVNTRDRGEKQGRVRRPYPRSPNRRCSATGFCARGKYNIYSKTYTEGSDPFRQERFNCASATIDAAASCGIVLPRNEREFYPTSRRGVCPGQLGQDIRQILRDREGL